MQPKFSPIFANVYAREKSGKIRKVRFSFISVSEIANFINRGIEARNAHATCIIAPMGALYHRVWVILLYSDLLMRLAMLGH